MTDPVSARPVAEIKACCARLYSSDAVRLLIGDSLHPGGTALTTRLADVMGITRGWTVVDLACGRGTSAVHLASTVGCRVIGIDYSADNIATAQELAQANGVDALCTFVEGDAEFVPLEDASTDAVLCECALCTFPDKARALGEVGRVLRPGGRFGMTDVTSTGHLPGLDGLLAWIACIADARSVDGYQQMLRHAGFRIDAVEDQGPALLRLIDTVRARTVIGAAVLSPATAQAAGWDLRQVQTLAAAAVSAVRAGGLGYALITATRP